MESFDFFIASASPDRKQAEGLLWLDAAGRSWKTCLVLGSVVASVLIVGFFVGRVFGLEEQLLRPPVTVVASVVTPAIRTITVDLGPLSLSSPVKSVPNPVVDYASVARGAVRTPPEGVSVLKEVEQRIFTLINKMRRKEGKASVEKDAGLRLAARTHSIDMLDRGYFDHMSPEGRTPSDRVAILHRQLVGVVGENIFRAIGMEPAKIYQLAEQIVTAWMQRPGHRANILNDTYTHVGVGVAGKGKKIRATQVFAEAQAFLQNELSLQVRSNDTLNFLVASGPEPERYDFWLPDQGISAIPHRSVDETRVNMAPGTYRLRLYFPGVSGYTIYNAPEVVVE